MKYEIIVTDLGNEILKRVDNNGTIWWIPTDINNSDYQQYLRWLENPNADEFQSQLEG